MENNMILRKAYVDEASIAYQYIEDAREYARKALVSDLLDRILDRSGL